MPTKKPRTRSQNLFNVDLTPENDEYIRIIALRDNCTRTRAINKIIEEARAIPENKKLFDRVQRALKEGA